MKRPQTLLKTYIFLGFYAFLSFQSYAQDLVKNGSFELLHECPKAVSSLAKNGKFLSSPTAGTTDIFSTCAVGKVSVPKNFRGKQHAKFGEAYAGLYLYSPNNYREYIQFSLASTLKKDRYYILKLFVSLAETSTVATPQLNVLFTNAAIALPTSKNLSKNRLASHKGSQYNYQKLSWKASYLDTESWVEVTVRFKAKGYESSFILGNFSNDQITQRRQTGANPRISKEFAYYYIDGVQLIEDEQNTYQHGEPYVIDGVRFKTDRYDLSETAMTKIRELYQNVKDLSKVKITINGHTDDQGSEGHNEFLSHKRAKAVANYLVHLGFPKERIVWEGHGNRKPLVKKLTEEARLLNRRVDFVITEFEDQ